MPVVISMGSVAASGGYWVATAGDIIFAEPATITGSIGVFGILPSFEGALQRSSASAPTACARRRCRASRTCCAAPRPRPTGCCRLGVESTYRRFLELVAQARASCRRRGSTRSRQGRVWDGGTARQLGLVDRFGGLDDAIAEAARRAKLDPDDAGTVYLERRAGLLRRLIGAAPR